VVFVVASALFLTNLLNEWDHTAWILLCSSLTMGSAGVFAGFIWALDSTELDYKVKVTSCVASGILVVIEPFILASFYGPEYEMSWVCISALLSVLTSFYCYYDLLVYQDRELYNSDDYIMAALYVYVDFFTLLWIHAIKPLFGWMWQKYQDRNNGQQ
jgi:FtsH-binding integral membrane protein